MIFHDFLIYEVLEPCIYSFYYTNIPQKILESIWEHSGKYYFCKYETQSILKKSGKGVSWMQRFCCLKLWVSFSQIKMSIYIYIYIYIYIWKYFCGDEDRKMMKNGLIFREKLGYEFHIYQKHEMVIWYFFYFQVRDPLGFLELIHIST